jgi:hypothetical protein
MKTIGKRLENRVSMYKVVLFLCQNNLAVLNALASIKAVYLLFESLVSKLNNLIQQKVLITTGLAKDKQVTKLLLADLTYKIGAAVYSYAFSIGDNTLMDKVNHTLTYLQKVRDNVLIEICKNYYDLGTANAANILGYGIDDNMLLTLSTSIDLFEDKMPQPREAIEHRVTLTTQIRQKDKEITNLLNKSFDKAIVILKQNNPTFVSDYYNSRKIFDDGLRHKKPVEKPEQIAYLMGNITDIDGMPMPDALLELVGKTITYNTETDDDGDYLFEGILSGDYKLTITFFGKKTITIELTFEANDEVSRDFTMETDENIPQ